MQSKLNEMKYKCEKKLERTQSRNESTTECYCQAIKRTAGIGAMPDVCFEHVRSYVSLSPHTVANPWVKYHHWGKV